MSSIKFSDVKHLQKAERNKLFAMDVAQLHDPYFDWQVIALFYAAVHTLQAYFTSKTQYYPQTHQERDDLIYTDRNLRPIQRDYRELKQLSVSTRYLCWPTNAHDLNLAQQHLQVIQAHINGLLS